MLQYLVILGAIVQLLGIFSYLKATLRGTTKPNRVTWLLWSVAPMIASAAALSKHNGWATLPVFMAGFGPLLVFIASFVNKQSYWKLERFDYLCGLFSVLALILWGVTKNPSVAIVFAIMSDALAATPTLMKAWKYPETETAAAFTTGLFNALTSFAAIHVWNFAAIAFPIYLVIIDSLCAGAILRNRTHTLKTS